MAAVLTRKESQSTHLRDASYIRKIVVGQFPARRTIVEGGPFRLAFQNGDCVYQSAGSSAVRSPDDRMARI